MGTRSLTVLPGEDGKEMLVMYRQMDGYPSGHGAELAEFLSGMKIVNGISLGDNGKTANGLGCLAAQIIAHFKTGVGGIYLHPAGTRDAWEEYIYVVSASVGEEPTIEVTSSKGKRLHRAKATYFLAWAQKQE